MSKAHVSDAVIRRLPMYYRHLKELEKAGVERISSRELGERMNLTASQIRQDINCFGGFGQQGYGYRVPELRWHIGEILGLEKQYDVIIVGAGNIGRAVANYDGFRKEGFFVRAVFDVSPSLIGVDVHGIPVQAMDKLDAWLTEHNADIAVLSVPASQAQATADRLAQAGIKAIWNFAPVDLHLPEDVVSNHVHLSDSLHILTYRMNEEALFREIEEKARMNGQEQD
ncbi:MAG: redox-sensing transcriptional repressor Rex [Clostridia bacterium]|nr:redox-sensing transcriptional repressor Rex [Clostridia bacterium]